VFFNQTTLSQNIIRVSCISPFRLILPHHTSKARYGFSVKAVSLYLVTIESSKI